MNQVIFSIIIPVRTPTDYLKETLAKLKDQSFSAFEVIVITDKDIPDPDDPIQIGPAYKRNLGASRAQGQYLAFLDDDSYPDPNWLACAHKVFTDNPTVTSVCGPCLTPPQDNSARQASGLVWASLIGSGGAGTYRNSVASARFVDDYPSVNLIIKKSVFDQAGGFPADFWPGEDTLLCRALTQTLGQKILYHPTVKIYHHRRPVLIPHLQQITRYALHRGYFARKYPENSRKLGYFVPSIFLIYNLLLPFLFFFITKFSLLPDLLYILALLINTLILLPTINNRRSIMYFLIAVPATHFYYGFLFLKGYFSPPLDLKPHSVDTQTGQYLGG